MNEGGEGPFSLLVLLGQGYGSGLLEDQITLISRQTHNSMVVVFLPLYEISS